MLREHISNDCDRSADAFREFILAEAMVHCSDNTLPELVAAFFVNRVVADDGEFVRSRRYENQHRIALTGLVHSKPLKLFLRNDQRVGIQLAALNINADFARRL